ncbi:carotenoid oxygenase family protein [Streptomyces sp. NPDC007905]|uniref:carotenoid oxygenase family protein n=1 Tax=Streptomyces sp. NPDC007905 TaxID=3364788 RepID=UPI0036E2E9E8
MTPRHLCGNHAPEAAFAPADATSGGSGRLMTYVHDAAAGRGALALLDAEHLTAPPVAGIHLPARVPFGFHGDRLPDAEA